MTINYPQYIYGLHEAGGQGMMIEAGRRGWVLELAKIGHNPADVPTADYSGLANEGLGVIVRINHGYGSTGTLPRAELYPQFAQTCAAFVQRSQGCHIWIIGNETNHADERPDGQFIYPAQYAEAYKLCRNAIRALPGHTQDQVLVAGPALWNPETEYPENPSGDWVKYFADILALIPKGACDGLAIHTYTHAHDPGQITGDFFHGASGYQHLRNEFRTYIDFMEAIPTKFRHLPVYITETDPTDPNVGWSDGRNLGWVRTAYREIANWNRDPKHQPILALILYRWTDSQPVWSIRNRPGIQEDFRMALREEPKADFQLRLPGAPPPEKPPVKIPTEHVTVPDFLSNQQVIQAFKQASQKLGLGNWGLMEKARLSLSSMTNPDSRRGEPFSGPRVDNMPLSDEEKRLLKAELAAVVGPEGLAAGVSFARSIDEIPQGFLRGRSEWVDTPLELPRSLRLSRSAAATPLERNVIRVWNRAGWLLTMLSDLLQVDPGVAVAVAAVSAPGRGFDAKGRLVIRFENHVFFDKWGQAQLDLFAKHFKFDSSRPWQGHHWRSSQGGSWRKTHSNQNEEWAAFELASELDETAARLALKMGAPQIMGFNYAAIGHRSVDQMFQDFSAWEGHQLIGLFDLICGPDTHDRQLLALQAQDFDTFAALHYGPGQAAQYASLLHRALAAFQQLRSAI